MTAAVAALVTVGSLAAQPALAQSGGVSGRVSGVAQRMLNDMMWREANRPIGQGHTYFHGEVGSLNDDQTRESRVIGGWGGTVTVAGFCDDVCRDLDLEILDSQGDVVASDVRIDTTPVVTFTSLASETYQLRVRMYDCPAGATCYYAVGAYYASAASK
ncbi:hypothetical protein Q0812_06270 [Brevundimonas sp. 2R-24]|uniref:Uncharacterized protein n=1 Tax=Peiella sedimenti TaxID=3061083 RepID=A0ABT8SKE1_9CAUL|nr:hypothetical protein [Caulobacteraceae bacterium XZ-24]